MYVTMGNVISSMVCMAVMFEVCEKYPILGDLKKMLCPLDPIYDPISYPDTL